MFVNIKFDETMKIMDLARFAGVAPCTILAVNKLNETELVGREILLPVSTPNMVRKLPYVFEVSESGRITKVLKLND